MQLIRCQDQKSETLDEFYTGISLHEGFEKNGVAMLDLINRLRALSDNRQVFGLTSLDRLCLLAEDTWESPWYVIIAAHDKTMYWVQYLMPEQLAPWPDAYVTGEARSEDDAVQMILIAMEKSEGWKAKGGRVRVGKHMNIEYFEDGAIDTPLILIYGNDPTGVEKLRRNLRNLVNDIVDNVAVHELPGYLSVDECKLFAKVDRDDLGVWRPKKGEPIFICSQKKETWIEVINKLKPFTDPHTYIYSGGCFQYLTNTTCYTKIKLMISTRRGW
jgi:hypothetical protein